MHCVKWLQDCGDAKQRISSCPQISWNAIVNSITRICSCWLKLLSKRRHKSTILRLFITTNRHTIPICFLTNSIWKIRYSSIKATLNGAAIKLNLVKIDKFLTQIYLFLFLFHSSLRKCLKKLGFFCLWQSDSQRKSTQYLFTYRTILYFFANRFFIHFIFYLNDALSDHSLCPKKISVEYVFPYTFFHIHFDSFQRKALRFFFSKNVQSSTNISV